MTILKEYRYSAAECGLAEWPSGELRLEGTVQVTDPNEADIFVVPGALFLFQHPNDLDKFPYMNEAEDRHVLFDVSDYKTMYCGKRCIMLRCNLTVEMLSIDPNSLAWAWPVENFSECIESLEGGFKRDVSFQGWLSTDTRENSVKSCLANPGLMCDIATYKDFCGYIYDTPEGVRRRAEFRRSMKESRLALCPESIKGVMPYRFYEAMSASRVPVCVSSDYVWPFADEIPYSDFVLQVPRDQAANVDRYILQFLDMHEDCAIVEMGKLARHYWERFLNREDWPKTQAYAVRKKLKQLGLYDGEVGSL